MLISKVRQSNKLSQYFVFITSRCYSEDKSIYQQDEEPKKVRHVYGKPYPEWRKPWLERENEWRSKLSVFVRKDSNPNTLLVMQSLPNFNLTVLKDWWKDLKEKQAIENQLYISERVEILGPNLAAAHFFTYRGASIR